MACTPCPQLIELNLFLPRMLQLNKEGQKMMCSHYLPLDARGKDSKLPVVIYCHCNSGSRRDAEEAVWHLLPCGVGVVAFDFTVRQGPLLTWHALPPCTSHLVVSCEKRLHSDATQEDA